MKSKEDWDSENFFSSYFKNDELKGFITLDVLFFNRFWRLSREIVCLALTPVKFFDLFFLEERRILRKLKESIWKLGKNEIGLEDERGFIFIHIYQLNSHFITTCF